MSVKKKIVEAEFRSARVDQGLTVKELSSKFGISQTSVKSIIGKLDLPKRAKSINYELVQDEALVNESVIINNSQESNLNTNI